MSGAAPDPVENITVVGHRHRHDPNELRIVINGKSYSGWQDARVTRGVERMPGDFEVLVTEKYPGMEALVAISPGDTFRAILGDDVVLTGYVDRYSASVSTSNHGVRITGRGKCQDLVDCSAGIVAPGISIGGQYNAGTVPQLFELIAQPFGIKLTDLTNGVLASKPVPQFSVNFGETPFEIIDRVARWAGCLAYEGSDGNLIVALAGTSTAADPIRQGFNVQSMSGQRGMEERFSIYCGSLMSVDSLSQIGAAVGSGFRFDGTFVDAGVPRFRPRAIVSEQTQNGVDVCITRCIWEGKRRYARSMSVSVVVGGWRNKTGALWTPNTLATVDLPAIKATPKDPWVIGEVTYQRGQDGGTTTAMTLMPADAFNPEPEVLQGVDLQVYNALHPLSGGAAKP